MNKPCLITLAVKRACANTSARRHANNNICILPPAIMNFSQVIDDLVKAHGNKIGKLHFHDTLKTFQA